MAFANKYSVTIKDLSDLTGVIYFQYDGWGGGVTALTPGETPFVLKYNTSDKYNTIVSSSLDVQVVYESALDDFFTEADHAVRVYAHLPWIDWYGFLVPNQYYRKMGTAPHYATFTATDQLKILNDIDFNDSNGDPHYYLTTDLNALSDSDGILSKTGLTLATRESLNVYEDDMNNTAADSPIDQVYFYPEMYWDSSNDDRGNCGDVLHDILKKYGGRIFTSGGLWYLHRPNAMWAKHTRRTFTAAQPMVYSSNTTDYFQLNMQDAGALWLATPEIEKAPRTGSVKLMVDPGMRSDLIMNGTFNDFTQSGGTLYYWTNSGTADVTLNDGYITLGDKDDVGNPVAYIYTDFYVKDLIGGTITIDVEPNWSGGSNCTLHFALSDVDQNLWWKDDTQSWAVSETHIEFDAVANVTSGTRILITIDLGDHLPENYYKELGYRFYIYEVEDGGDTTASMDVFDVGFQPSWARSKEETEIITKTNATLSYNKVEDSLRMCDTFAGLTTFQDGMYWTLRDGTGLADTTEDWYILGDPISQATNTTIQDLLAQQYLDGGYEPRDIIHGTFVERTTNTAYMYSYDKAIVDDDITDSYGFPKVFIPLGVEHDVRRRQWTGTWEEVAPVYTDSTLEWADHDFGAAGTITANQLEIVSFTITAGAEEGRFTATHAAVVGEMIRMVIVLTAKAGGSYLPNMTMDGDALTVAWGTNYIEYYCDSAGAKELVITGDLNDELNLTCTVDLYYCTGI